MAATIYCLMGGQHSVCCQADGSLSAVAFVAPTPNAALVPIVQRPERHYFTAFLLWLQDSRPDTAADAAENTKNGEQL